MNTLENIKLLSRIAKESDFESFKNICAGDLSDFPAIKLNRDEMQLLSGGGFIRDVIDWVRNSVTIEF